MNASTITTGTFTLQGPAGAVAGTVAYNAQTATLTPSAALATGATYTATVVGGASGVKDTSGTAMAADFVWSFTTATPAPPTVTSVTPASGATGVATTTAVTATFSKAMNASTITTGTFTLQGPAGAVAGTVAYNAQTATLTPSAALANGATYTATVVGGASGVKDTSGTAMAADFVWSFTTAAAAGACPCTIWPSTATPAVPSDPDASAIEVGVKFRSDVDGSITGIRFYKGTTNTGTHVGNLWTAGGALLASVTFSGETASGWQQANFTTPVGITANIVYVASYFAPAGRYAVTDANFASAGVDNPPLHALSNGAAPGNGVYTYGASSAFPTSSFNSTNYWVDVVFTTSGPIPPTVTSVAPANGATAVATGAKATATFSKPMDPTTITTSSFTLQGPSSVPATVAYDAATLTATLTPSSPLASGTTYTATVRGGATGGVKDTSGTAMTANFVWSFTTAGAGGPCAPPANPILCENSQPGNPKSQWDITGAGDSSIQGFATNISVNRGQTVRFKIDTSATAYRLDIYRMGYYNGAGARLVASIQPSAPAPQTQPNCLSDATTGLIDCGNWAESASWAVPSTATSGIYFAKLVRLDASGASHIFFVVRDDSSASDILFQTSDTTWQAYNTYGGNSFYVGAPAGRAYKVSYNRPFNTREGVTVHDWVFYSEYPMVRWLEANGYDVTYFTGVDSDRNGALIRQHKVFLSVGHDEYWSAGQRTNVEAARNAGVHLGFFSGNEVFWKTRWENSIDGSGTAYRTLVSYKETHANAKIDPLDPPIWTGTWRDPRFSPPADGGHPENALTGTIFTVNDVGCCSQAIRVPAANGKMRFWRNTSVATLAAGATATLPNGTLGYEWDEDLDNGFRPPGLISLSSTTLNVPGVLQDYGSTYGSGTAIHSLTLYRHASRALVFGAGTIQWSWGLDSNHDVPSSAADGRMQQATVNLLADMGAQPKTLQSGLVLATQSTDITAPTSTITSPASGSTVTPGQPVTITGTAADSGGGVLAVVEVSVDGGVTWHRASGTTNWTYTWVPVGSGTVTIGSSATDDSGNTEAPHGITVTVGGSGTAMLLGQATIQSQPDSEALGRAEAFPITANANGTVSSLTIYLDATSTATRLVAGLYTNGSNHPAALLAQGNTTALTPGSWNTITIPGVSVTSGTTYWIAILGTGSGALVFRDSPSGGCLSENSSQTTLTTLPATWTTGAVWTGSCPVSAYGSP
jgi:hypothetical protein